MIYVMSGGGSGGGSAFVVVGGTTRPTKAAENMLWINTTQEITSYVFSATEPKSPANGMLWLELKSDASKKLGVAVGGDYIQLYLGQVRQRVGGAWEKKTSRLFCGGEWVDLIYELVLFDGSLASGSSVSGNSVIPAVDVTGLSKMSITGKQSWSSYSITSSVGLSKSKDGEFVASAGFATGEAEKTVDVDISKYEGLHYLVGQGEAQESGGILQFNHSAHKLQISKIVFS